MFSVDAKALGDSWLHGGKNLIYKYTRNSREPGTLLLAITRVADFGDSGYSPILNI